MRGEHGREGTGCDNGTSAICDWAPYLGEGAQVLAAEVAVAAATCCANSHRLFRIAQHSCSFEYLFTPRQQSKRTFIKKYPHIVAHGRSPIDQCIFQENLEIPGRRQQHQITIIYLGRPFSSSITNTNLPYFRYYTRINYIGV